MLKLLLIVYSVDLVYTQQKPYDHEAMADRLRIRDRRRLNPYRKPEDNHYDKAAVWECIENLKEYVRAGVTSQSLHIKLHTKMMSLRKHISNELVGRINYNSHQWEDPVIYDEEERTLKYPKWVWSDEEMLYVDKSAVYELKPWEDFIYGEVKFVDPFDNTDNY